jgi:hypothetical protein
VEIGAAVNRDGGFAPVKRSGPRAGSSESDLTTDPRPT